MKRCSAIIRGKYVCCPNEAEHSGLCAKHNRRLKGAQVVHVKMDRTPEEWQAILRQKKSNFHDYMPINKVVTKKRK